VNVPRWLLVTAVLGASCAVSRRDPFADANRALQRGDLAGALASYERVPCTDDRYAAARAQADFVIERWRRGHELVLEAQALRRSRRYAEALSRLLAAQRAWARLPGLDVLIAQTKHNAHRAPVAASQSTGVAVPAAPASETRTSASAEADPEQEAAEPTPPSENVGDALGTQSAPREDHVTSALVAAEARLSSGQLDRAIADLEQLAKGQPSDLRVRARLVRLLQQRALMRYGSGVLTGAIADWERVFEFDPTNDGVLRNLRVARVELQAQR
jgi:tetratricopeptide (TPR) repeat protein